MIGVETTQQAKVWHEKGLSGAGLLASQLDRTDI